LAREILNNGLSNSGEHRRHSVRVFAEENDAVCVGPASHVVNSPDVRGFGELLLVDQDDLVRG